MIAVVLPVCCLASCAVGLVCGWFARRSKLVAQIHALGAERRDWRARCLAANSRALSRGVERDDLRAFLAGAFDAGGDL